MNQLVSILIPCYNAERWIKQAIESALSQSWPHKEVIVVDDGSTDGSLDVIKVFGDSIRWETGPNRGGNVARNRLLELARGDWLQYLDADDYLLPDKISKQMEFLAQHPETDIVYGRMILEYFPEGVRKEIIPSENSGDMWVLLARWFIPGTGSPLWSKQAVIEVGGWAVGQPCCQEHELYLRLLMAGKQFNYFYGTGYIYRQWGSDTVSKRNIQMVHGRRLEIEQRAEDFLRSQNALTPARRWAINQARFEIARIAWQYDRRTAMEIIESALRSDPGFIPGGNAAPTSYRLLFRLLGFRLTESIAAWHRQLLHSAPRNQVAADF